MARRTEAERAAEAKAKAQLEADRQAAAQKAEADRQAAANTAAREAELRAREAKIEQQTAALSAARQAEEQKKAEADRQAGIELAKRAEATKRAEETRKLAIAAPASVKPSGGHPSGLRSMGSTTPTKVTFSNDGDRPVDVYWISFEGTEKRYFTLPPGKSFAQSTYVSHSWIVRDAQTQRQLATAVATPQPSDVRVGELTRSDPASNAPLKLRLVGRYENHQHDQGGKNDWHYVTLTDAGADRLKWSNRAGASWTLTMTQKPRELKVGNDSPYHADGHTTAEVEWNRDGTVKRLRGPGGEWYDRTSR